MLAKLSPELVRGLTEAGDEPLPVENPQTKRRYVIVDVEQFDVVRRNPSPAGQADGWTESKNERRCALIHKKFSQGIDAAETKELTELQEELSAFRNRSVPLPYDAVDTLQATLNSLSDPLSAPAK